MYSQKIPKSDKPRVEPYTIFNPHDRTDRDWSRLDQIQLVSIDPGSKNFAIRVEIRPWANKNIPIRSLLFERVDFSSPDNENSWDLHPNILRYLDSKRDILQQATVVIIEKQLSINYNAVRISQHVLTYFMILLKDKPTLPFIVEIDPKTKGKTLGAPKNITKPILKKWAVDKAKELCSHRGDIYSLSELNKKGKVDDLADTIVQAEALFIHLNWTH